MWRCVLAMMILVSLIFGGISGVGAGTYENYYQTAASPEAMAYDGLLARPFGTAATVTGIGFFLATLPVSLTSGSTCAAGQRLVKDPGDYTFRRPMGREYKRFFLP